MHDLLIVDDHAAVRAGLAALVAAEPGLRVAGTAADAETALNLAEEIRPALVVVDFHLPGEDGLHLCLRLAQLRPRPGLVLYSAFADDLLAALAAIAGADALVPKGDDPDRLLDALHALAGGHGPAPAALAAGARHRRRRARARRPADPRDAAARDPPG